MHEVTGYTALSRVTSDCKAWPAGGRFGVCHACGFPQTITDDAWRQEIARIYGGYTIYFQGSGAEQSVFDARTGKPNLRSDVILERLLEHVPLADAGQLLDVGCGNGNFLRAFAKCRPHWSLDGSEWDDKYAAEYRAIPSFRQLHTVDLDRVTEQYDVVSIIHCLEHVPNPRELLGKIHRVLRPGGLFVVQVPDCAANPFMLTVADHCSHFSTDTLAALVSASGFEVRHAVNTWIPKELTVVARRSAKPTPTALEAAPTHARRLEGYIRWLADTSDHAHAAAKTSTSFGIFGTAIAGTWLHMELRDRVAFFVDEDPARIGREYLGRPVYAPNQVPKDAVVYIGLPPALAAAVRDRLGAIAKNWVVPPAF
jgi:SAM-dependent methyltransferase